ncbi:MAG TPA: PorP/SprF family type IX secretion system membrane protein, partial [Sphingobacterium sp.]|nr:PorP/SprF family type IX secretion system membrane protein [Sphingobacterium sp.]
QMTSFNNAPQTFFLSGEARLSDVSNLQTNRIAHNAGLAAIYDTFGTSTDVGLNLSYAAETEIIPTLKLRAGLAVTYNNLSTDLGGLNPLDENDPAYQALKDGSTFNKYGLNAGVAVVGEDFYAGYAAHDAVKASSGNTNLYEDVYVLQHSVQAGYRYAVSETFGVIGNALYRYDSTTKGVAEGQVKAVLLDRFWVGGGYRQDVGAVVSVGARFGQFKFGYSREINDKKVNGQRVGANEIIVSYNLTPVFEKGKKALTLW